MTELKQTVYKTIEVAEDEDYGMVIGNIVMDGDKMLYAEITGGTMCNHEELVNARAFLDEVEEAMSTNTSNVSNAETTPIINEECVGCCKVVDIAAKLQKELDEYKETIRVERIDRAAEKKMINRKFCEDLRKLNATIEEYKEAIQLERIDHITTLKTVNQYHHTKIKALKDSNIDDLKELYDFHEGELEWFKDVISERDITIVGLEAELSARKHDSQVLEKVVEIVKNWDDSTGRAFPTLYKILDELVDYTDALEGSEDTTTDSGQDNAASCNHSCTVEMDIRCE